MSFSIYVHLPFCAKRCLYCDFVSSEISPIPFAEYIDAVHREWDARAEMFEGECISIYLGGGTPSLWPAPMLARLIAPFEPGNNCEITIEANPGDCSPAWLGGLTEIGTTRLSIGVQALDDKRLRWLGRRHDSAMAKRAVTEALSLGEYAVSADIMYGTPGQTSQQLTIELIDLYNLGLHHISAYELTVANETPLGKRAQREDLGLPDQDQMADMWEIIGSVLSTEGFERYEVSSHALKGHRSRHNERYWSGSAYAGLGAGAHGFIKSLQGLIRYSNTGDLNSYLRGIQSIKPTCGIGAGAFTEEISGIVHAGELVMLGLRTTDGLKLADVAALVSEEQMDGFNKVAARLQQEGQVVLSREKMMPTHKGMLLADLLATRFF